MITIQTDVRVPVEKAWEVWTKPEHIVKWNFASPDWECPSVENDVQVGGKLLARMQAKDGSFGFDFGGTYDAVEPMKSLAYHLDDARNVHVTFEAMGDKTRVVEMFDAEQENSEEMQRNGWQAILNNYKTYAESI